MCKYTNPQICGKNSCNTHDFVGYYAQVNKFIPTKQNKTNLPSKLNKRDIMMLPSVNNILFTLNSQHKFTRRL